MGSPHVQGFDRVTDGHIAVHAHHDEGEGAGEHVVVVYGHHSLTQSIAKRPETQEHISALRKERHTLSVAGKVLPFVA